MKKFLSLVLAMLMVLSLSTFAAAEETTTLTFWVPQYQFSKDETAISDIDFWNAQFDAFEEANNCVVNVEILPWADYNTTIYTGLLNNDGPDIVYVTDTYDLVSNNLLLGLDSYLTEAEIDNYLMWGNSPVNAEGEHCTIPMNGGAVLLFYNKDILAEAGVEEPNGTWTWDEFIEVCKTIEANTDKQAFTQNWGATTGTSALMTSFWPYYFQAGGSVLNDEGEVDINNEAGLATLEFLMTLYNEGIFDDSITAESAAADKFGQGELAMYAVGDSSGKSNAANNGINYGYVLSLTGSAGMATRTACDSYAVSAMTVSRGTDELAVAALKYICSGAVEDAFHENVYYFPRFTKDASYVEDEALDALYTEQVDALRVVSEFEGKASFENALQANIQSMFMGDLSTQEVLDETMSYYQDQIKQ